MQNKKRFGAFALVAGMALVLSAPAAFAQKTPAAEKPAAAAAAPSPCKGLDEAQCGKKAAGCIWRAASKRKDGVEVKAHCRKKPDIAKAKAALAAKKAEAPAKATPKPAASVAKTPTAEKPVETTKAAVKKTVAPPPASAGPAKAN